MNAAQSIANVGSALLVLAYLSHSEAVQASELLAGTSTKPAGGLSLEETVALVLSRYEKAKVADLKVEAARAAYDKVTSGLLPSFSVSGTDTLRPYSVPSPTNQNSASASVSMSQPIFAPSVYPLRRASRLDWVATRHQSADDKRLLTFDAAKAFFSVLTQEDLLRAAERRVSFARISLDNAQGRFRAMLVGSNDVTRAELELATAERDAAILRGSVQRAYLQLRLYVNRPVEGPLLRPKSTLEAARIRVDDYRPLVGTAEKQRHDLIAAHTKAEGAWASAEEPKWRLAPTLSGSVVGRVTSDSAPLAKYFDTTLGLSLSWTIWDGGSRGADLRSREASAHVADLEARLLRRKVSLEVQTAQVSLASAQATLRAAEVAAKTATRSAAETETLYRQGLARALELTDANGKKFDADVALANAELSVALAYLELRAALGTDALGRQVTP